MPARLIEKTPSAYTYPLLIKNILRTPLQYAPDQEIVYRDQMRYTYRDLERRIHKLANMLAAAGVKPGDTVAVMDWDSHRYLECFFAVPMMGAILHTINIRLSPDQLLYTINHAEDDVILVYSEFLPMLEAVKDQIKTVRQYILLSDGDQPETSLPLAGEYEALLAEADEHYDFPGSGRKHHGHDLLHHRHHRPAQGGLLQPPPASAAHLRTDVRLLHLPFPDQHRFRGCLHAHHPHVPCPCLGRALSLHHDRHQTGLSGTLRA